MTPETKRYLDEAATARLTGLSPRSLQRARHEGWGPAYVRIGLRKIAYDESVVVAWAAARTHQSRAAELAHQQAA